MAAPTVTRAGLELDHSTWPVTSNPLLLSKLADALNCCVCPIATLAVLGEMSKAVGLAPGVATTEFCTWAEPQPETLAEATSKHSQDLFQKFVKTKYPYFVPVKISYVLLSLRSIPLALWNAAVGV